jgi:sigma-B regulation protein RsbU (phosphoserine phosphatase)
MRILVAEDDPVSRALLGRSLAALGHEVLAVADGQAALEAYVAEPRHVVITDWRMPRLDGLELTRRIRALRARSYPWIVMLTALEFREHFKQSMEAGVDDYLEKPLDRDLLVVRLKVAERVLHMSQQVRALSSALPICMHCKSVRDAGQTWQRIEDYFKATSDIDFSHALCPDCFYDEWLAPALAKARGPRPRKPAPDATLDLAFLDALEAGAAASSPGLFAELVEGLATVADAIRRDLHEAAARGAVGNWLRRRLHRHGGRCADIGLGKASAILERLSVIPEGASAETVSALAREAEAEIEAALAALAARSAGQGSGTR